MKTDKLAEFYEASKNQGNSVDRFWIFQRLSIAVLVHGAAVPTIEKLTKIFLFRLGRLWELVKTYYAPLGYLRMTKIHLGHLK